MTKTDKADDFVVWQHGVITTTISKKGQHVILSPDGEIEKRMCAFYDLLAIYSFDAHLLLQKITTTKFRLSGRVKASVDQPCVVSLVPVRTVVDEEVDVVLVPASKFSDFQEKHDDEGALMMMMDEDVPDFFEGDRIDVAAIMLEHFALGLNSYPQAEGATLEKDKSDGAEAAMPFAGLAALRNKMKPN